MNLSATELELSPPPQDLGVMGSASKTVVWIGYKGGTPTFALDFSTQNDVDDLAYIPLSLSKGPGKGAEQSVWGSKPSSESGKFQGFRRVFAYFSAKQEDMIHE